MTAVSVSVSGSGASSRSLARPKSRILAKPVRAMTMFSGLRSRWVMPAPCAVAMPSAIWATHSSVRESSIRPRLSASRRVSPSTSSMAMKWPVESSGPIS
jgi:hypothetical protein